jgi:hypothetical protein
MIQEISQNEITPFYPRSSKAVAKLYAKLNHYNSIPTIIGGEPHFQSCIISEMGDVCDH